jgi:hypothetical protein
VLPVSQEELLEVLIFLADDSDAAISQQARSSLEAFPDDVLLPHLQSSFTALSVFDYFSRSSFRSKKLLEAIILNTAAPDEVIARLAAKVDADLIDAVLINVMRVLRTPEILEALEENPNNTVDTRRRLGEVRHEFFEKRNTFVPVAPITLSELSDTSTATPAPEELAASELHPVTTEHSAEEIVAKTRKLLEEDGEEVPIDKLTLLQRISQMTVAERVQIAMRGSKDDRLILIRDSNRVVAQAVLHSPKISENEVESMAQMRNVNEEVLRLIGFSRAWAKNYAVIHNLVRNPRTPLATTLVLLNRIMPRDLKALTKNRNIPEVARKSAQRLTSRREKGSG